MVGKKPSRVGVGLTNFGNHILIDGANPDERPVSNLHDLSRLA